MRCSRASSWRAAPLRWRFAGWTARELGASSTVATGIGVAFAGFSMVESYGVRAQVLAWPLAAALVYLLRCASPRLQWFAVPLVALWANLHASAMLAPVILAFSDARHGDGAAGPGMCAYAITQHWRPHLRLQSAGCCPV